MLLERTRLLWLSCHGPFDTECADPCIRRDRAWLLLLSLQGPSMLDALTPCARLDRVCLLLLLHHAPFPSSSRQGATHQHDRVTTQGYPSGRRRTFGLMTLARVRGRCHTWPPQPFFFHVVGQIPVDPGSISSSFSALQLLISLARTSWAIFLAANIKDGRTASNSSSTTTIAPLQIPDILDHGSHGAGG